MQARNTPISDQTPERTRVVIIDDDPLARSGMRDRLEEAGMSVVGEAADGRSGARLAWKRRPDVVLVDMFMGGIDGLDTMRMIHERAPDVRCLVLTVSADPELGMLALRAGAQGYLSKQTVDANTLPRIIKLALDGEIIASRGLTTKVVEALRDLPAGGIGMRPVNSALTSREWEVLDHLCLGRSTAEIADALVLSQDTVRSHIKNLMRKLGARTRAEAIERAAAERSASFSASRN